MSVLVVSPFAFFVKFVEVLGLADADGLGANDGVGVALTVGEGDGLAEELWVGVGDAL